MVVLDSSGLIPLARTGHLDLLYGTYDDLRTVNGVVNEVLVPGKRGTAALESFSDDVEVREPPSDARRVADLEGVAETDAAVVLLASTTDDVLLANDRALIAVARSNSVECDWVTTLLLRCVRSGVLGPVEAKNVLDDLVVAGMNLHPRVYVSVRDRIDGRS